MRTNINIIGEDHTFNYIIDYKELNKTEYTGPVTPCNGIRNGNQWTIGDRSLNEDLGELEVSKSLIRLYIPDYTVSLYNGWVKYYLNIKTWVNGKELNLGEYIFDETNTLACDKLLNINGLEYNEYIDFYIYNPFEIMYSDKCKGFREEKFGEVSSNNANGSTIYLSLQPIEKNDDVYVRLDGYEGGENCINLSTSPNEFLSLSLKYEDYSFKSEINFNSNYSDLKEYLAETYYVTDNVNIYYNFVIKDKDNIYKTFSKETSNLICSYTPQFSSWSEWKDDLEVASIAIIKVDDKEFLTLKSSPIPLTQEIARYMFSYNFSNKFNLNNIDMNIWNIKVTNTIKNEIVELDSPKDSKSNIVDTVFYKTHSISNILVHPAVTEFISINLDAYKSRVSAFVIQLEGIKFKEYARVNGGVLFKIVGNELPNENTEGTYHILNEEGALVTSGKYRYE